MSYFPYCNRSVTVTVTVVFVYHCDEVCYNNKCCSMTYTYALALHPVCARCKLIRYLELHFSDMKLNVSNKKQKAVLKDKRLLTKQKLSDLGKSCWNSRHKVPPSSLLVKPRLKLSPVPRPLGFRGRQLCSKPN